MTKHRGMGLMEVAPCSDGDHSHDEAQWTLCPSSFISADVRGGAPDDCALVEGVQ